MNTKDFNYDLPPELIAQTPIEPRDASRLLVYDKTADSVSHLHFFDIEKLLNAGDVLVINNTRVINARLFAHDPKGRVYETLLLKRIDLNRYEALLKPARKAKIGTVLQASPELSFEIQSIDDNGVRVIRLIYDGVLEEILDKIGEIPLPPYITEKLQNKERYQTVYSKVPGSSAAPTAGLHFTTELLERLKRKGVIIAEVMLNVGLGTFRPVKCDDVTKHIMHSEYYEISAAAAAAVNSAKKDGRRVIAVGTTSVRTLESSANFNNGVVTAEARDTAIFIYPPYEFKAVDAIITNFHLPESTLIMLISAFLGREKTLELYKTAVDEKYRFFSFGDAMFVDCGSIRHIYYGGNAEQYAALENTPTNGTVHYYSEAELSGAWHFIDGVPTIWE
ncbi:MAG: tRNA preQ1(34) S-adenosylmethionine ribosyltransferase-isomerase QueA [Christensenellaceae bacterium]|nr:tRNA preQ1(34) S-adenosylmethionine ribosyltransferase-isomerase QueA [Christensenellaceae bacterium]